MSSAGEVQGREHLVRRQVAMMAVFKRFSVVWSSAFRSTRRADLLDTWLDACRGIDSDGLDSAAREFLASGTALFPPKPWEFAKFARQLQAKHAPGITHQPTTHTDPLHNARPFWFERHGPAGIEIADAWQLAHGGCVGIAECDMDRLYRRESAWGWGSAPAAEVA